MDCILYMRYSSEVDEGCPHGVRVRGSICPHAEAAIVPQAPGHLVTPAAHGTSLGGRRVNVWYPASGEGNHLASYPIPSSLIASVSEAAVG